MALKVTYRGGRLATSALLPQIAANPRFNAKFRKKLKATYQAHAQNAVAQIERVLDSPLMLSGTGAGARSIEVHDGGGAPVRIVTATWPALNVEYARRRPRSFRTWKKRGDLSYYVKTALPPSSVKATVIAKGGPRSHHKDMVALRSSVSLAVNTNPTLLRLIALPFVAGSGESAAGFVAYDLERNSSELLGYVEAGPYKRPFVVQTAAALGRRAHTAVRTLRL